VFLCHRGVFSSTGERRRGGTSCCDELRTQPTLPTANSAAIWPLFNFGEAKYRGKCCQIFSPCVVSPGCEIKGVYIHRSWGGNLLRSEVEMPWRYQPCKHNQPSGQMQAAVPVNASSRSCKHEHQLSQPSQCGLSSFWVLSIEGRDFFGVPACSPRSS
jgi:hypothetical protein